MASNTTTGIPVEEAASDRGLAATRVGALAPGRLPALLMEAIKHEAVDLALGTPGTPTPPAMVEAARAVLAEGAKNQ